MSLSSSTYDNDPLHDWLTSAAGSRGGRDRLSKLTTLVAVAAAVLFVKTLLAILAEYRWYFPPDFDSSAFLSGRRESFVGLYPWAFYAHIVSGPLAATLGLFLMLSGGSSRRRLHRLAGKTQVVMVLAFVAPSGLVMAQQAFAGPIAASGFAALALTTGACAAAAAWCARARRFQDHQAWATRCFILLCSPLLLRLIAGATIVTGLESAWTYRLNAWLSWLIPLAVYEVWRRSGSAKTLRRRGAKQGLSRRSPVRATPSARPTP